MFIIVFSMYFTISYSQEPISYTEVVNVDSTLSANELYSRARSWFAETYRSAQDVIQMDDKENAKIIGKSNFKYDRINDKASGWVSYTITIEARNGRYKYTITNFIHESSTGNLYSFGLITDDAQCPYPKVGGAVLQSWRNKIWDDIKSKIKVQTPSVIKSLKSSMNQPALSNKDNW